MSTVADQRTSVPSGLLAGSWAFAIRIWIALVIALYVSFWLQLESPTSAGLTIAVLALPTRGEWMEKAFFRLIATAIGLVASIVIVALFAQSGIFFLLALSVWMGICVYATGLFDGNKAYAAALCGTTVALVAIPQIDSPQLIFEASVARGSAVVVGVVALAFVSDILAAPDSHPNVVVALNALSRRVLDYSRKVTGAGAASSMQVCKLLQDITALRPQISGMAIESVAGEARRAAAHATAVELVVTTCAAHALQTTTQANTAAYRSQEVFGAIQKDAAQQSTREAELNDEDRLASCSAWLVNDLFEKNRRIHESMNALQRDAYPTRQWQTPYFPARRAAMTQGLRAALAFAVIAIFLGITGWPTDVRCLSLVAVLIGISATTPDVRGFTTLALIVAPISCVLTGILLFVVLDGATNFIFLAIGLAPFIVGSALLIASPRIALASLGRANLAFTLVLLAPTNPQTYNPETFLVTCLFLCLAAFLLFVVQFVIPPITNEERLHELLETSQRDLDQIDPSPHRYLAAEELLYRDVVRIGQVAAAAGLTAPSSSVDQALYLLDRTASIRRCIAELAPLANSPLATVVESARAAVIAGNAIEIENSARQIWSAGGPDSTAVLPSCSTLLVAARILGTAPSPAIANEGNER